MIILKNKKVFDKAFSKKELIKMAKQEIAEWTKFLNKLQCDKQNDKQKRPSK